MNLNLAQKWKLKQACSHKVIPFAAATYHVNIRNMQKWMLVQKSNMSMQ